MSSAIATVLPRDTVESWIGMALEPWPRLKLSAFVATLATAAGGMGGNLEDEGEFKARFFFDEEV